MKLDTPHKYIWGTYLYQTQPYVLLIRHKWRDCAPLVSERENLKGEHLSQVSYYLVCTGNTGVLELEICWAETAVPVVPSVLVLLFTSRGTVISGFKFLSLLSQTFEHFTEFWKRQILFSDNCDDSGLARISTITGVVLVFSLPLIPFASWTKYTLKKREKYWSVCHTFRLNLEFCHRSIYKVAEGSFLDMYLPKNKETYSLLLILSAGLTFTQPEGKFLFFEDILVYIQKLSFYFTRNHDSLVPSTYHIWVPSNWWLSGKLRVE